MNCSRRLSPPLALVAAALLAACAPQPAGSGTAAPPPASPTRAPVAAVEPTRAPTAPPTAVATTPTTAAAPTTEPTAAPALAGPFAGIPQSRTAEGYQVLGAADAPVTMVMYSDFL